MHLNNKKKLETIIMHLSRYSSGDNSQPFFFQIDEENLTIKVFHDYQIAFHCLNSNDLSSLLSLGIILQMMEELSFKWHFNFKFNLVINEENLPKEGRILWGTFYLNSITEIIQEDFLEDKIFMNVRTNRMPYKDSEIKLPEIDEDIKLAGKLSPSELQLLLVAESILWKNSTALNHVFNWVHITKSAYLKKRAGFHYTEINMKLHEALILPLLKSQVFAKLLVYFPFVKFLADRKSTNVLKNTPGIYGIYANVKTPFDLIEVGKKSFRIKLAFAKHGYATQPLSLATFPFLFKKFNVEITDDPEVYIKIQKSFKDKFAYHPEHKDIVWMFRVGYPEKELTLSLRKDISELIVGK